MADYFTHFSCLLDVGTPEKAARALTLFQDLRAADQDADEPAVAGFDLVRQNAPEGSTLFMMMTTAMSRRLSASCCALRKSSISPASGGSSML